MVLRLSDDDDRLLSERAAQTGHSKHQIAVTAVHTYLTTDIHRLEELEDQAAIAAHDLAHARGEVTFVPQEEAKARLGITS